MKYIAHFVPQAWVNDYAVDTDPEGDQEWDCTKEFNSMPKGYRTALVDEMADSLDPWGTIDRHDWLKDDPAAPEWVRNHRGPFTIWVREES